MTTKVVLVEDLLVVKQVILVAHLLFQIVLLLIQVEVVETKRLVVMVQMNQVPMMAVYLKAELVLHP